MIKWNESLTSLAGLDNLVSIEDELSIFHNDALNNLTALENVTYIGGSVEIIFNDALTNLAGLDNVTSIGGSLEIYDNVALASLAGLNNLTSVGEHLIIGEHFFMGCAGNPALNDIYSLENLESINGELRIECNESLSTCHIESICAYLANPNGEIQIDDNAPGCNSPEEVLDSCEANAVSIDENMILDEITLYPNPATNALTIQTDNKPITEIKIFNLTGQLVIRQRIVGNPVDVSNLRDGIYVIECLVDDKWYRQKLLIQE
jgi:hypothetical protein